MFKINCIVVDTLTGEPVLITNGISRDMSKPDEYVPFEGLVFTMQGKEMVTWSMQNIEAREFRDATKDEEENLMPQFRKRLDEIANEIKRDRRKK